MTLPDALIEQCRDVFDSEYRRVFPQGGDASDHDEAVRSAVAAVVAVVQADTVRRISTWVWSFAPVVGAWRREQTADAIEREFGGTQPEERAA